VSNGGTDTSIRIPPITGGEIGPQPAGTPPEWQAYIPALNIYRNGLMVNEAGNILTPPGPGPFPDPNYPDVPTYTFGAPNNSDIQFNGFILGWLPPPANVLVPGTPMQILATTPPTGQFDGTPAPPGPQPPPWNGTDDETTYITNCVTYLTGQGVAAGEAQAMCQTAWDESQSGSRVLTGCDPPDLVTTRAPAPTHPRPKNRSKRR
jgi:hypothetical protein